MPFRAITPARRLKYLENLRVTGSHSAAAVAASPHLPEKPSPQGNRQGNRQGYNSFFTLRKTDPLFAVQCEEALDACLAAVETALMDRAMKPPMRPIVDKNGVVVASWEDRNSSDRLLLRVAAKLNREDWSEKHVVEQTVTVRGAILSITPADVLLLDSRDQDRFLELCEVIANRKGEPAAIEHMPMMQMPAIAHMPIQVTHED